MDNSTICTSGEQECIVIDEHETRGAYAQGEDEIARALSRVNDLLDEVKKGMKDDVLRSAIMPLRSAIGVEEDYESRAKAEIVLAKALVTRFAHYGWAKDLDEVVELLLTRETPLNPFASTCEAPESGSRAEHCAGSVVLALDSLQKCRRSIDTSKLETVIVVSNEALASTHGATTGRGELLLRIGNALVLKYLASDDESFLVLAGGSFEDARRALMSGDPMLFAALFNLQHVISIKSLECKGNESAWLLELKQLREEMQAEDDKGRNAFMVGSELMKLSDAFEESALHFRQSLSFRPPGHPSRHDTLVHCAIALLNQYRLKQSRGATDFCDLEDCVTLLREALDIYPPGHPGRPGSLSNLAGSLFARFQHKGNIRDLEECVSLSREALDVCPPGHPGRHHFLNNLAEWLFMRFEHTEDLCDLDECVTLLRESVNLYLDDHPNRPQTLNNLAASLSTRFEHKDNVCDLEECVTLLREALDLLPVGHPDRPRSLDHLATSLSAMFEHKRDLRDLEECVTLLRERLDFLPEGHPDRPRSLNILATSLSTLFQYRGDLCNLEECVALNREALDLYPEGHPNRCRTFQNLANSLFLRFEHKRDFCDLEESVTLNRRALDLRPAGDPERPIILNNLARTLSVRFEHKGGFHDLQECVMLIREALDFHPAGHPNRPVSLNNLATSLSTRFKHKGDLRDLEDCVALSREALDCYPLGHLDRLRPLNNLAATLSDLFNEKGDFRDLEESINLHREVLAFRPAGHPDRLKPLNNLAISLSARFEHKGDFRDLEECITLIREALDLFSPAHPDRSKSLNNLAALISTRFEHKGGFRDLEECITLTREALKLCPPGHPGRRAPLSNLANSLSIRSKYNGNLRDLEESATLHREALDLCPPGHADRSRMLTNLATLLCTRFMNKGDSRDLEESVTLHKEALDLFPPGHPERPRSLNNLANALYTRFEHKGDLSDMEACIASLRDVLLVYSQTDSSLGVKPDSSHILADHPFWLSVITNLVNILKVKYHAIGDSNTLDEIFQLLSSGAQSHGSSPLAKLNHAGIWSLTCRQFGRLETSLDAYSYGVEVLPQLASLDLTLEQRQNVLVHAKNLSRDAVQCAIERGDLEMATVFLSTARSVFWSQALQFRGALRGLDALYPDLASDLRTVTRQLEIATHENAKLESTANRSLSPRPYLLAQKREAVIARIRAIDGFHDFLLPPSFEKLKSAARENPIAFLNASEYGCDVLILKQDGSLHHHPLSTDLKRIAGLTDAVQQLSRGQAVGKQCQRNIDDFCGTRNTRLQLRRKNRGTADDDFKQLLETLWVVVAEPVIRVLGLKKNDNPPRIWWCPTGPFAFLPIHAAGIYSDNPEASDCLSDYVVSSYCSSPQDLIAPPPAPNPEYEVLVVVEPGESGPRRQSLPWTLEELERIQRLVPHERHLVTRVGSADTPSNPEAILGHINTASVVHFGGGRLTMRMLIRGCQASNAALAYLSACETAMGDQERPDESLSLAATMQFAGFRSVVATMWEIHDEDAPIVADAFYSYLFRRGTAAPPDITDAAYGLHLAMKKLRDHGAAFHRWVPFVHHGI